jgi:hypothetical protein
LRYKRARGRANCRHSVPSLDHHGFGPGDEIKRGVKTKNREEPSTREIKKSDEHQQLGTENTAQDVMVRSHVDFDSVRLSLTLWI